jgi:hypothetical protein
VAGPLFCESWMKKKKKRKAANLFKYARCVSLEVYWMIGGEENGRCNYTGLLRIFIVLIDAPPPALLRHFQGATGLLDSA